MFVKAKKVYLLKNWVLNFHPFYNYHSLPICTSISIFIFFVFRLLLKLNAIHQCLTNAVWLFVFISIYYLFVPFDITLFKFANVCINERMHHFNHINIKQNYFIFVNFQRYQNSLVINSNSYMHQYIKHWIELNHILILKWRKHLIRLPPFTFTQLIKTKIINLNMHDFLLLSSR